MIKLSRLMLLFLSIVFAGVNLWAQSTATILGTVTDPTGAVVPDATVTITNTGTGTSRTVTSNQSGAYNAPDLQIGTYSIKVDAPGFKRVIRRPGWS